MRYLLLIIYMPIYVIRPSEWVPGILGTPLLMVVGVLAVVAIIFGMRSEQDPNMLNGNVERMMLGFIVAICLSHLSHGYIGGAIDSLEKFLPSLVGFFLVLISIKENKRFDFFILFLIALISFVAYEGIQQYRTGYAIGGMEPYYLQILSGDGETVQSARIRWYGVFNDPNDLGLLLVIPVPFLINMLMRRKLLFPLICLPLIIAALYYTNSRGSMLAGIVAICSYFLIRYRSKKGLLIGLLIIIPLLMFGPSRMAEMSGQEESAHGRIESWYEGYQMFKSNPLFGVGMGSYTDHHYLTAHNTFVQVMAELGFVGLFFFTGLIYYPMHWLYAYISNSDKSKLNPIDSGSISACYASLSGTLTAMFFLSRAYILLPYIMFACATSLGRIIDRECTNDVSLFYPQNHIKNILLFTILQIIAINFFVKLFI